MDAHRDDFLRREGKCQIDCGGGDKERGAPQAHAQQRVAKELSWEVGHRGSVSVFDLSHSALSQSVSKMMPLRLDSAVISTLV